MAKFGYQDAENYGGGMSDFFTLKDDKDTAKVRFMYNGIDEVQGVAVHQVQIGDKTRYVNCLRNYDDPMDACPLCAAGLKVQAKLYVPLYDIASGTVKLWERGRSFFSKMSSLCGRYNPLVAHTFEIERNGKKGDTNTTYEIYDLGQDNTTIADLPEVTDPVGTIVLDKSYDDLNAFLELGYFPGDEQQVANNAPVARNPQTDRRPAYNGGGQAPQGGYQQPNQGGYAPRGGQQGYGRQGTGSRPNF